MHTKRALLMVAVLALPGVVAGGQATPGPSPVPPPRNVETRADQELKRMSDVRYFWETGAQVRTEGQTLTVTATFPVPSVKLR